MSGSRSPSPGPLQRTLTLCPLLTSCRPSSFVLQVLEAIHVSLKASTFQCLCLPPCCSLQTPVYITKPSSHTTSSAESMHPEAAFTAAPLQKASVASLPLRIVLGLHSGLVMGASPLAFQAPPAWCLGQGVETEPRAVRQVGWCWGLGGRTRHSDITPDIGFSPVNSPVLLFAEG